MHPYRVVTYGKANLSLALNSFAHMRFTADEGWNQNAMDAALLGLTAQAQGYVLARAAMAPDPAYRFPAFMPHLQDYPPSGDHLGVMNSAVQYMLAVPKDNAAKGVWLLPSWPCAWDVVFKVNAPNAVVITGSVQNGKASYKVVGGGPSPDVTLVNCQ